jgi:hypothetical protein
MSTKVFRFGALPPAKDGAIRYQMRLGRDYYNRLVEAENARRRAMWGGDRPPPPPHEHANGESKDCSECKEHWEALRKAYRETSLLDVKPVRAAAIAEGLYCGTYRQVEESFAAAWKKTDTFSLVRFRSWRQGGLMSVQIQCGCDADRYFQIRAADDPRTGRRKNQRHTVRLRIGSDGQRPIWSEAVRLEMHRPIQGIVAWAKVCLAYSGDREIWSVQFTSICVPPRHDEATDGAVAIDVSWRSMPDGTLRLAFARDADGQEHELRMPARWRERVARAERIRGHRDRRLNELKAKKPAFARLQKPRGARRVAKKQGVIEPEIAAWLARDRHLEEYELGCRRKSVAARRDALRNWLRMLRRRYATAIIKDTAHKEMKAHSAAVAAGIWPKARYQGHHGAPGETVEELCQVYGRKTGVAVFKAAWTTSTCAECGEPMEVGPEREVTCESCGAVDDRDRVSTRNLLARYADGETTKPTARKTSARFAKRHSETEVTAC